MTPTPKDTATAVPADFRLPWNTTRTMADVWGVTEKQCQNIRATTERAWVAKVSRRYVYVPAPDMGASDGR